MPTLDYEHDNVLKKVHIGETDYYVKDADLRTAVEGFGSSVSHDSSSVLDPDGTDLPTESAVAGYMDDFKTNEVDPKVSVVLGNDEDLIFNYIPVVSGNSNTYTVTFDTSDIYIDSYRIHITSSFEPLHVTPGNALTQVTMDHGSWQEYEDLPDVEFVVYNAATGDIDSSANIRQNGWCTDLSDPGNTYVYGGTVPEGNMTIYPNLYNEASVIVG